MHPPSRIDPFLAAIALTVGLATLFPARGGGAALAATAMNAAVALVFFLHGARLSPQAALAGARHWRLHGLVAAGTFLLFPLIGLIAHAAVPRLLPPSLWVGLILLTALPSTVQASITFTTIAGGNVPAALCSASASNLLGIVLTPLVAGMLLSGHGADVSPRAIMALATQLAAPFAAGQLLRRWIGVAVARHSRALRLVDHGGILLIVYAAFSRGTVEGLWHQVGLRELGTLVLADAALLAAAVAILIAASRWLGFSRADAIAVIFCGSTKSLAAGLPIASVLFAGATGLVVLPMMLFHQIQLMVSAALARHLAARRTFEEAAMSPAA
jgi:sodium/bile acid cotransporter 7